MKIASDLVPLAVFFAAYQFGDIYIAVIALMVSMPVALVVLKIAGQNLSNVQKWTCAIVLVSGSLTILLREPAFILAKPTIVYWTLACLLLVALRLGRNPAHAMLAPLFRGHDVPMKIWRVVALQWVTILVALGILNWLLAATVSESVWVSFKTFGFPLLTVILLTIQTVLLYRKISGGTSRL